MDSEFFWRAAGLGRLSAADHVPIGPYSDTQVFIGLGVLAALIVIVTIAIWRRGRKG